MYSEQFVVTIPNVVTNYRLRVVLLAVLLLDKVKNVIGEVIASYLWNNSSNKNSKQAQKCMA
jgi:DNA-binding SARP family transcriptional activator